MFLQLVKMLPAPVRPVIRTLYRRLTPPSQLFRKIYRQNVWGGKEGEYYSGNGSHAENAVGPYLQAVGRYLKSLSPKVVVDLGCGDFNVSRHLVPFASRFVGCDVVRDVIRQNRRSFPGVEFRCVDIARDRLPEGDVCIVRQVFQHLDNRRISSALRQMTKYDTWIITEHLPAGDFAPNIDTIMSAGTRLGMPSGVVLTEPPFNFHGYVSEMLCEVVWDSPLDPGLIRTDVFLRPY
jgi:SAM-dependent methyltransferase